MRLHKLHFHRTHLQMCSNFQNVEHRWICIYICICMYTHGQIFLIFYLSMIKYALHPISTVIWNTWQLLNKVIHCNLGEVFFWSAWIALPFLLDKKLMQRASDQVSWKCACRTESPPHECFYLILLFHKNATCGRNTTAEEIDNSEQGNKARWDVFWCPDQSKRFFFVVQSATTSAGGRLAGQQQPLSLAGRNAPRGWQAARTIWLVLLLLKTGWKCIACAGSHCCSCC